MIRYLPKLESLLWELKCQTTFDTLEEMKETLASQMTRYKHYVGKDTVYTPGQVMLLALRDRDPLTGWKHYCRIMLDDIVLGHCGE